MTLLDLFATVLFCFGTLAFGATFLGVLGEVRGRKIGLREVVDASITLACFGWFLVNTLLMLAPLFPGVPTRPLWVVFLIICFLFPGLIMSSSYTGPGAEARRARHPIWRIAIAAAFVAGMGICALGLSIMFGVAPVPNEKLQPWFNSSIPVLYILAAVFSMLNVASSKKPAETPKQRRQRRGLLLVLGSMILVFLPMILSIWAGLPHGQLLALYARMLPLAFLFLFTYQESRFQFFDVLVRRAAVMALILLLLSGGFALTLPWLKRVEAGWAEPWIYAIVLLPLGLAIPWLSRRMGQWVDHVWIGRRFTTEEAVRHFLTGLRGALDEDELARQAEDRLGTIFRARARVDLSTGRADGDFRPQVEVPVMIGPSEVGTIRLGPRENDMPYFRRDTALAGSLAEVFASLLQNARLQRRKQEQEQRTQELSLRASRSELKALRAQINPHFLFNALNAIAGLIHKDPQRADRAVEHLAEVFRYTLRGSEKEWATLEQELEFARAYLDVEQARFGSRLEVSIDAEPAALPLVIPTMLLQTLVENAVKHGVATVRGTGRIAIDAIRRDGSLIIEVADNGPGFAGDSPDEAEDETTRGYGLANVRRRLDGHFGGSARLAFDRDEEKGWTRVAIEVPESRLDASEPGLAGSPEAAS